MDSARNSWMRFEKSGKLSDYLDFCEQRRRAESLKKPKPKPGCEPGGSFGSDQSSV